MCELGAESSDWVMIDNWEAINPWEGSFNVSFVKAHVDYFVGKEYPSTRTVMAHMYECLNERKVKSKLGLLDGDEEVALKLVCGEDLIDTFARPGLWKDEDVLTSAHSPPANRTKASF